jgi:hypothetical protein
MLSHLQTHDEVTRCERSCHWQGEAQVMCDKALFRNLQLCPVHVVPINTPNVSYAVLVENVSPRSNSTADIDHTVHIMWTKELKQRRNYDVCGSARVILVRCIEGCRIDSRIHWEGFGLLLLACQLLLRRGSIVHLGAVTGLWSRTTAAKV